MQEDKHLHKLLNDYSLEEPSADFNQQVMLRVSQLEQSTKEVTIVNKQILRLLVVVSTITLVTLLVMLFIYKPANALPGFNIIVNPTFTKQMLSFLAAFWVVFIINAVWNKRMKTAL